MSYITFLPHLTSPPAQLSCRGCRRASPTTHGAAGFFSVAWRRVFFFFFPRIHGAPPRTYQQKPLITTKRFHTCNLQTSDRWRRSIGPRREINLRRNVVENSTCNPPVYLITAAPLHLDLAEKHAGMPGYNISLAYVCQHTERRWKRIMEAGLLETLWANQHLKKKLTSHFSKCHIQYACEISCIYSPPTQMHGGTSGWTHTVLVVK